MAASWQDHVHLWTTSWHIISSDTTGEWTVMAKGLKPTGLPEHYVVAAPRRSLDGTLRHHVLMSGSNPVRFTDYNLTLKCDALADLTTLRNLLGKKIYFIPAYHDPAAHPSYDVTVFFDKMGPPESIGPTVPVIHVPIHLTDAD